MAQGILGASQGFPPEKQEQAKKAWQLGRNLIYRKEVFDAVMNTVRNDPVQGLAEAVVMVLHKIDQGMGKMPHDIALATGLMLMADIADALGQTGRVKYEPEQIEQALSLGVQLYLQSNPGGADKAELHKAVAMFKGGE